jgi:2-oxo-4-hydroxy-4-carboxy--5-ureidoimidazoline (OHCU) decarboxylase
MGHWMNIGKFRAQAWDQAQKLSEIQKNINPSEKSDASTILKEYSEVILADQAQKLTDIIDGIIKSFKHDNKILKHIEDVSSNQRKVLSVLHTLPDRDETAKNIQASINEMNEVFKEVQDTYETTKQSLKQGLVTLQNLVNSMENDEISSNTISKVEQKMRRISRQLKMEKPSVPSFDSIRDIKKIRFEEERVVVERDKGMSEEKITTSEFKKKESDIKPKASSTEVNKKPLMQIWKDNQLHLEEIKLEMGVARWIHESNSVDNYGNRNLQDMEQNIKSDYDKLLKRYKDISKKLTTVSDSSLEEEVASINDMFKREMPYFLKLHKKIKATMEEHKVLLLRVSDKQHLRHNKKNRLQDKEEEEIHQTKEIEGGDTLTFTQSESNKEVKIKQVKTPLKNTGGDKKDSNAINKPADQAPQQNNDRLHCDCLLAWTGEEEGSCSVVIFCCEEAGILGDSRHKVSTASQ